MAWVKRPRHSPRRLYSEHLNTVLTPDDYQQPYASAAQKPLGYPWEGQAGRLEVREWSPGNLLATYVSYSAGIAKRAYSGGSWTPWRDAMGKEIV